MKTEVVPIDEPTPDPANARKHGERNLQTIIDSLKAFGQQKPIVVDGRGIVVAGNGTLEAAKRLGWKEIAVVRSELDPTQATAFGIADNRTAELAEWDADVLKSLVDSLDEEMTGSIGFDAEEIDRMLGTDGQRGVVENDSGMTKTKEEYDAAEARTFIVYLNAEQYQAVVDRLDYLMEDLALDTHAEALVHLCVEAPDEGDPNQPAED